MWSQAQARAVGQRVAAARKAAGLTQSTLVRNLKAAGVSASQTTLSHLERGMASEATYTSLHLLATIAAVTGVDVDWLISGAGTMSTML